MASKYRELALMGKRQEGAAGPPSDGAQLIVSMLNQKIETFDRMLHCWVIRSDERNKLRASTALVPRREVADRLQRYEGSLERAFDRTLAQLERLQRLRLGQPVLPALKVDLSH